MSMSNLNRIGAVFLMLAVSIPCTTRGQVHTHRLALENRQPSIPGAEEFSLERQAALALLQADVPTLRISLNSITGSPKFVRAHAGFIRPATGARDERDPTVPIRAFLDENRSLFGHGSDVLADAELVKQYVTERGFTTITEMISTEWRQTLDELPIFGATLAGHITPTGDLITLSSQFIPNPKAASLKVSGGARLTFASVPIPPQDAIALAAAALDETLKPEEMQQLEAKQIDPPYRKRFSGGGLAEPARIELGWIPISRNGLRPCWRVTHFSLSPGGMFFTYLDAATGELYKRETGTGHQSATYKVFGGDSPTPGTPGFSNPTTAQPSQVSQINKPYSYYWVDSATTETYGNNVDARIFLQNDISAIPLWGVQVNLTTIPGFTRPSSTTSHPTLTFNHTANLSQSPTTASNRDAAVVNAFFWSNWAHDRLVELGFDEAAGNFEQVNSSGQGTGGDAMLVNVQFGYDGGFRNQNWNETDPQDGLGPNRIRLGIFDGPSPDRDTGFDNEVILHEYTHGLYRRLVGPIGAVQSFGIEEATCDFMGLSFLSSSSDPLQGSSAVYPSTGFMSKDLSSGGQTLTQNYYFGIRAYPTSTVMTKSPITLKDLDWTQASSHVGIPRSPLYAAYDQPNQESFKAIDFWLSVLWEAHANLVSQHYHSEGSYRLRQLVVDALKLVSPNPTFCEMRDAIISADFARFGAASYNQLWAAFAKRGLGYSASCPDANWYDPISGGLLGYGVFTEAFDVP